MSRAANVVWMLEEVGVEYERRFVDVAAGEQKRDAFLTLNPMGKLPVLQDAGVIVTESAAIALYLADRYAPGRLAPPLDHPARGTYLRWAFFAPSVIEPGLMAKAAGWVHKESQAGWDRHQAMLATMQSAISGRQYLLGDRFSMADVVYGGTIAYMLRYRMLEALPAFTAYVRRLGERPALKRANAINDEERDRRQA